MQGKMILIGVVSFVLAMVFAFMFVISPLGVFTGRTTLGDYYSNATLSPIMLFLFSVIASYCFFYKIGKKTLHSASPAVLIGLFGLLIAIVFSFIMGRDIANSIVICVMDGNYDTVDIIKKALISDIGVLVGGFVTGFGMTILDFSKRRSKGNSVHTEEQMDTGNESVSRTAGAILAFFFGGLGVHRYYLGYKKQGAIQTCGFISILIASGFYICGNVNAIAGAFFLLLLALYGTVTSVWAFVDFIRILTGGLQPANGKIYAENRPQQVQIVQSKETTSDTVDAIAKLAKLHEQGILSDEEFQRKKTELLKRM